MLVVAAPTPWRHALVDDLAQAWYSVSTLDGGLDLVEGRSVPRSDVAIVDLGLRAPSGLTVCSAVRSRSSMILLAIGTDPTEDDVVEACNAGADGFLPASASSRVLLARVRGLLRRIPIRQGPSGVLGVGAISLDLDTGEIEVHGRQLVLRRAEHEILSTLVQHANRVVARSALLRHLSVLDLPDVDVEGCLRRLREVLAFHQCGCTIATVRKVGVRLVEHERAPDAGSGLGHAVLS